MGSIESCADTAQCLGLLFFQEEYQHGLWFRKKCLLMEISEVKEGRLRGRNKRKNKYMMIRYHLFQAIYNQGRLHFEIVF